MAPPSSLVLVYGSRQWSLDRRPITIGRLPECDVVLAGNDVSRRHATVIPTPHGPLLVDQSRHGVTINEERVQSPWLLAEHDTLRIGPVGLYVVREERTSGSKSAVSDGRRGFRAKLRHWLQRYGPSEILGTAAAVGAGLAVKEATGSTVAAAYAGAIAETTVFYGIMFLRESIKEAHQAGKEGRDYRTADLLPVFRNLLLEFGVAEALDVGIIRPLCLGAGLRWVGGSLGLLLGNLTADLAFYGPVLMVYEWRLARRGAIAPEALQRRTTSASMRRQDLEQGQEE
jgi:hypothetical protein